MKEKIEILEEEVVSQNKLPSSVVENLVEEWLSGKKLN